MGREGGLLLKHVLQRPGQILEHRVQDALLFLLLLIPTSCRDGLLGSGQASLTGLLQGCLLLCLLLFFLLQPILGKRRTESYEVESGEERADFFHSLRLGGCVLSALLNSPGKLPSLEH